VSVASTSASESKRRNGKMRHASTTFPFNGLTTHVGQRLINVVQERPIMALTGAVALGFVAGAAVTRRDGRRVRVQCPTQDLRCGATDLDRGPAAPSADGGSSCHGLAIVILE